MYMLIVLKFALNRIILFYVAVIRMCSRLTDSINERICKVVE